VKKIFVFIFFICLFVISCSLSEKKVFRPQSWPELFNSKTDPLISAHRGGAIAGFPENCISTFENSLTQGAAIIECDVRMTQDSVLIILHDESLERTTTGNGNVRDKTWHDLQDLNLLDPQRKITPYSIPRANDIVKWASGRVLVTLDVKRGVPIGKIVNLVKRYHAKEQIAIITYTLETAKAYFDIDPTLYFSVTIRNIAEYERYLTTGIPTEQIVAFVGLSEPNPELYTLLGKMNILTILGTMGNLDRQARRNDGETYVRLVANGANILSTDQVHLAAKSLGINF